MRKMFYLKVMLMQFVYNNFLTNINFTGFVKYIFVKWAVFLAENRFLLSFFLKSVYRDFCMLKQNQHYFLLCRLSCRFQPRSLEVAL